MKKTIFAVALLTATCVSVANAAAVVNKISVHNRVTVSATPPVAVQQAFTAIFGNIPVRQWKLRSNGQWRAHFLRNGRAWEATFSSTGVLVKSEPA